MSMQKEARRTDGRFSQKESEDEDGRIRLSSYRNISMQHDRLRLRRATEAALRHTQLGPEIDPLSRYRHATHYASAGQCTCAFCDERKENRAARVACNQSHAGRARCIVLRSAARGYAPPIVNIARGHSCDDVQRLSLSFSLCLSISHHSRRQRKFFVIVSIEANIDPPRANSVKQ